MKQYLLIALMLVGHACGQTVINGNNRKVLTLSVSPANPSVVVGSQSSVDCLALLTDGTQAVLTDQVSWMSSDTTIARVDDTSTLKRNGNLLTGVAVGSATITCTDPSGNSGSTTVQVVASPQITLPSCGVVGGPCPLPGGSNGALYSFTFTQSGGTSCNWTVTAGSLPGWATLDLSGLLHGTAATGSSSFTVQVSCASGAPKTMAVTLAVTGVCTGGPPTYLCSNSGQSDPGVLTSIFTSTAPTFKTCAGDCVNRVKYSTATNPSGIDGYTRVTDGSSDCGAQTGQSMNASGSGGSNDIDFSLNSTYLAVFTTGSFTCILHLDGAGQVLNTGPSQLKISSSLGFGFSRVNDKRAYYLDSHHILTQYDIVNDTTATTSVLFDFTAVDNCPGMLSGAAKPKWNSIMTVVPNAAKTTDDEFVLSFSLTGVQGTGVITAVWSRTKGCSVLQTDTGSVWSWCTASCSHALPIGTETVCSGANGSGTGIHETLGSLDGVYAFIERTGSWPNGSGCAGISTGGGPLVWKIATTSAQLCNATDPPVGQGCVSHSSVGVSHAINTYYQGGTIRNTNSVTTYTSFTPAFSPTLEDWHAGWPNPLFDDSYPYINASDQLLTSHGSGCATPITCPIYLHNMMWAEFPNSAYPPGHSPLFRLFGPTFACGISGRAVCATGPEAYFQGGNSVIVVSQDGKWLALPTSMFCSLGLDSSNKCRQDVFLVSLM